MTLFVYVANWGTHEFYICLPQESVDYKLFKAMVSGGSVQVRKTARFVIVEFGSESEWDGEDDGTGWMASLMPLRSDLLRGDLRCLYLGCGFAVRRMADLLKISWNRPCLQAWKNYPVPSTR
ncbi:MAG: hypothetical protein DMG69_01970 [Acidobacteria bacterium]|nr:MAG: hypothetical protein DMG69_01970 [Acidobacteriota bacterium]